MLGAKTLRNLDSTADALILMAPGLGRSMVISSIDGMSKLIESAGL